MLARSILPWEYSSKGYRVPAARKYGRKASEELRGKQADFEVTDISTAGSRFAMDTSQRSQEDCTNSDYFHRNIREPRTKVAK